MERRFGIQDLQDMGHNATPLIRVE